MRTFLIFSGSLRQGSFNTALARAFVDRAPADSSAILGDIRLPLYDQDLEVDFPAEVTRLKDAIRAATGIILITPEHNRSFSAAMKNFVDWTSRPYGDNAWAEKPVFVAGASTGAISAALAQYDLKQVLLYLDARVLGQPEFFLGNVEDKIADGELIDEKTLQKIDEAYAVFSAFCA